MAPPPAQTEIGKYRLLRKIATGGMAEVYLAQTSGPAGFQKTLVLKRILPHLAEDANFVGMFLNEAKLAALLNHPGIVQIFDLGEADGSYFIAMEYIDGPNLRALCRKAVEAGKVIPYEYAAKVISMACEGLHYAHDFADNGVPLNLIHRDISPDNILISRQGAVKVVDFGIAKAANQGHVTKTGTLKGKLAYMPPEQLRGKPMDRRADIFSLGVVLYELLGGMKPFDATSEIAAMQAILHDPPTPLNERRPDCPAELVIIVERALEKERENRYPDCRAMQRDLEQFLISRRKAIGAYELSQLVIDIVPPTPVPVQPAPPPTPSPPREIESLGPPKKPRPVRPEIPPELSDTFRAPRDQAAPQPPPPTGRTPAQPRPAPSPIPEAFKETVRGETFLPPEAFPEPPRRKKSGMVLGLLGGAAVALGAIGGFLLTRSPADLAGPDAAAVAAPAPAAGPDAAAKPLPPPAGPDAAQEVVAPDASAPPPPVEPGPDAGRAVEPKSGKAPRATRNPKNPKQPEPVSEFKSFETKQPEPKQPEVRAEQPQGAKPGSLYLEADPPCAVTFDGRPAGSTPLLLNSVAPGAHTAILNNRDKGIARSVSFTLAPGEEHRERVKFVPGTIIFRVQPWAYVEVDGKAQGQTPIPDGVQVYEGEHRVRLYNTDLKKETVRQIQVKPGGKEIVKVNFLDE
ncbi:MAG TPA: serine/threonine-protein kinase [Myxococcales bacterium]|jgi:serine/threonine-protein kinase